MAAVHLVSGRSGVCCCLRAHAYRAQCCRAGLKTRELLIVVHIQLKVHVHVHARVGRHCEAVFVFATLLAGVWSRGGAVGWSGLSVGMSEGVTVCEGGDGGGEVDGKASRRR